MALSWYMRARLKGVHDIFQPCHEVELKAIFGPQVFPPPHDAGPQVPASKSVIIDIAIPRRLTSVCVHIMGELLDWLVAHDESFRKYALAISLSTIGSLQKITC